MPFPPPATPAQLTRLQPYVSVEATWLRVVRSVQHIIQSSIWELLLPRERGGWVPRLPSETHATAGTGESPLSVVRRVAQRILSQQHQLNELIQDVRKAASILLADHRGPPHEYDAQHAYDVVTAFGTRIMEPVRLVKRHSQGAAIEEEQLRDATQALQRSLSELKAIVSQYYQRTF